VKRQQFLDQCRRKWERLRNLQASGLETDLQGTHQVPFGRAKGSAVPGHPVPPMDTHGNGVQRFLLAQSILEKLEEYRVLSREGRQSPFLPNLLEYAKPGSA